MRKLLLPAFVATCILSGVLPAQADACNGSDIAILFEGVNFEGGCVSYNGDGNILGTFNNGNPSNDGTSSLYVQQGYRVRLFEHANYQGASKEFVGQVTWIGPEWNDRASSLWIDQGSCPEGAIVQVFVNSNYGGGCKTFDTNEADFFGNSFDDGVGLNDQISSIKVASGYQAVLYTAANYSGESRVFAGNTSFVGVDFNDVASSISIQVAPPDGQPPTVSMSHPGSLLVAGLSTVFGDASDDVSGIAYVELVIRPAGVALSGETVLEAALNCDAGRLSCAWSAQVPLSILPGSYEVYPRARDVAGFGATDTAVTVLIT